MVAGCCADAASAGAPCGRRPGRAGANRSRAGPAPGRSERVRTGPGQRGWRAAIAAVGGESSRLLCRAKQRLDAPGEEAREESGSFRVKVVRVAETAFRHAVAEVQERHAPGAAQ